LQVVPARKTSNELPAKTESSMEDDSLPKEARISIIPDQDELHDFPAYAT